MFYSICITYENFLQDISRKIYSEKAICKTQTWVGCASGSLAVSKVPIRDRFRSRSRTKRGKLVLQFEGWAWVRHPQLFKTELCLISCNGESINQKTVEAPQKMRRKRLTGRLILKCYQILNKKLESGCKMSSPCSGYSSVKVRFFTFSRIPSQLIGLLDSQIFITQHQFSLKKSILAQLCVTSFSYATRTHHCHRIAWPILQL